MSSSSWFLRKVRPGSGEPVRASSRRACEGLMLSLLGPTWLQTTLTKSRKLAYKQQLIVIELRCHASIAAVAC